MIVLNVIRLKAACESNNIFARLVASQTIATRVRDFHTELTYLEQAINPSLFDALRNEWDSRCQRDEIALLQLFGARIGDFNGIVSESSNLEDNQLESACLLQHKLRRQGESCSPDLKALLDLSLSKFYDANVTLPVVPEWFIPPHELDVDEVEARSTRRTTFRSKWTNSSVMISLHRLPRDMFAEVVEKSFQLSHPNVVKVFGASHIHTPFRVVFENTSSLSLREYLTLEVNKHLLWQKLFEVSLGLKYLLERGVIVERLRCDTIWIGMDGLAKINALHCIVPQVRSRHGSQSIRQQAPETIRGESSSAASAVYSLGICILEALAGELPRKNDTDGFFSIEVPHDKWPHLPVELNQDQQHLLESMLSAEPSERPAISSVVLQLKEAANENPEIKSQEDSPDGIQTFDLESYIFPDLKSTIKYFLEKLAWKCSQIGEFHDAVMNIVGRLRSIYALLQSQRRLPSGIAVESFCEVLLRLDRFMRSSQDTESALQRIKSQRVALRSNEFHRQLDELLELLAPSKVSSIHTWREPIPVDGKRRDFSSTLRAPEEGSRAVNIVRFPSDRVNRKFEEVDFAAIDAAAANEDALQPPWLMQTYNLQYSARDHIGVGAFGAVYRAMWLGTPVVIKFMGYEADEDAYSREMFFHELRVWLPLNHPHVVKLYGACHMGKRFFVCEFVGNGTLDQYLKREGNADKSWQLLYQVALGLQHLHENNILHNDLKCDNVLIGTDGDAKLMDFGLSSILNSAEVMVDPKKQGAVHWKSPEYLRGDRPTLAADIYSFGMLILEALIGAPPWGNAMDAAVRCMMVRKGISPPQPACISDSQWILIKMMCASDPSKRVQISFVVDKLYAFSQLQESTHPLFAARLPSALKSEKSDDLEVRGRALPVKAQQSIESRSQLTGDFLGGFNRSIRNVSKSLAALVSIGARSVVDTAMASAKSVVNVTRSLLSRVEMEPQPHIIASLSLLMAPSPALISRPSIGDASERMASRSLAVRTFHGHSVKKSMSHLSVISDLPY